MNDQKSSVFVDRGHLKALLRIAPKQDIRYYLCGVCIEADATQTTMVATDGHRLLVLRKEAENKLTQPVRFIVAREIVENVLRLNVKSVSSIELEQESEHAWSAPLTNLYTNNSRLQFHAIPAEFPDWRRVVPESLSGEAGHFNADYLHDLKSVAKDIGCWNPVLLQNGPVLASVAVFDWDANCIGVIMPMKQPGHSPTEWKRPEWCAVAADEKPAEEVAA